MHPSINGDNMAKTKCGPDITSACNSGGLYFLGFIGALVYYISVAAGFWAGVLGVLKSVVWPVFLVYGLLKFLGA